MKKIEMVKLVTEGVVGLGVSTLVHSAVRHVVPIDLNTFRRICVGAATFVTTSMVSEKVSEYTNARIDDGAAMIKELVKDGELDTE